jgi:NCS1 family nucleobase:cation symporter-1
MLFIPLVYWIFSFIGIVVASAGQAIYGKLYWDPTAIIALWTNRAGAFFCAFAFGLATLGTNISTNSIASSNDFAFIAPKWLNIRRGAFLTAMLGGWATCPWQIQASATSLTTFLSGYIIVLAPIVAIMVSRSATQPATSVLIVLIDHRLLAPPQDPPSRPDALSE